MTAEYTIEEGVVSVTLTGEVGPADIMETWERILNDPAFVKGMHCLIDNSKATTEMHFPEAVDLVDAAKAIEDRFGPCKWAIVSDTAVNYGISMMFAALADRTIIETRAFLNRKEALAWLRESS
ncbi:MAG: hypothetical protein ACYS47_13200 [Planctomycetota bacterium]|jgi:hypothetical protein